MCALDDANLLLRTSSEVYAQLSRTVFRVVFGDVIIRQNSTTPTTPVTAVSLDDPIHRHHKGNLLPPQRIITLDRAVCCLLNSAEFC